ncbi:MAG: nucleotidyltransferase family protein [Treponema sp.]|nr:nucleotidyltransferase family protein [Treponema sp.]
MRESAVDAILMASGFSRRFGGENKLLVPFRGKPLVRHTLELVSGIDCIKNVILVTSFDEVASEALKLSNLRSIKIIRNDHPERGQRESVRLGVEASSAAWYLFFPCDQPLLDTETVMRIIGAAKTEGRIIQPFSRHAMQNGPDGSGERRPGNPVLFSSSFREELLSLKEGEHPRDIKAGHPEAVYSIEVKNETALFDADDPETLLELEGSG